MCSIDILNERSFRVELTESEEIKQKPNTEHNGLSTKDYYNSK